MAKLYWKEVASTADNAAFAAYKYSNIYSKKGVCVNEDNPIDIQARGFSLAV